MKVHKVEKVTKINARVTCISNHMHIFRPWRKHVQSFKKIGIKLYGELRSQGTHCLHWGQKMILVHKLEKVTKNNLIIISKPHAHPNTQGGGKYWEFLGNTHNITLTRGPWATTLALMYSYEGYIQPKYCKCCMQEKLTFCLPWQLIKFSSLDLIYMVVRGLLKEHYYKAFVKISKDR